MTPADAVQAMLARHGMPPVGRRAWDLCVFGVRNDTNSDRFDDCVGVAYRTEYDGPVRVEVFRCTVDPGRAALLDPSHPRGVFRPRGDFRHPKVWRPGDHKHDPARPALRQVGVFVGFRDNDRDDLFDRPVPADDAQGVNLHGGMGDDPNQRVGRWSEGCTVTAQRHVDRIRELVAKQRAAGMGDVVSYHLFERATNFAEATTLLGAVGVR